MSRREGGHAARRCGLPGPKQHFRHGREGGGLGSMSPRKCSRHYCPVCVEASHWTKMKVSDCNIVYDIVYDTIYDIVNDIIATYSKLDESGFLS